MDERENNPDRIITNLLTTSSRMDKVDETLEESTMEDLAEALSRILRHGDTSKGAVCGELSSKRLAADVCIQIFNAAAELETAFHAVRLCNVPASFRQARVGAECIGSAILMALPMEEVRQMSGRVKLLEVLESNPGHSIADLFVTPRPRIQGKKVQRVQPKIKANMILPAFVKALDQILGFDSAQTNELWQYILQVYHPAAHGATDNTAFHFEGLGPDRKVGLWFSEERVPTFRFAARNVVLTVDLMADFLDATATHLAVRS